MRTDIGVPGNEIVVNRDSHEDVYVALRAFDAAKRQLDDYSRRLRRETKTHEAEYISIPSAFGLLQHVIGNALIRDKGGTQ